MDIVLFFNINFRLSTFFLNYFNKIFLILFVTFSPLEQFEVLIIFYIGFGNLFVITNINIFLILIFSFIILFSYISLKNITLISNQFYSIFEILYSFVYSFSFESLGKKTNTFFTFLFTIFFFVLLSNMFGLIPYSFTLTSQFVITFFLGFISFFGLNFIGFKIHGLHFFSFFLPQGAPLLLAPFLVLIEIISYVFRVFSLSIRLFANMFAGHTLLYILSGFSIMLAPKTKIISFFSWFICIIPIFVVFLVMWLELSISFLQAYVFTVLTCLYLNDAIQLH